MRGLDLGLGRSTVLGERLPAHTTRKLAVEDQVIILQILILLCACLEANLCQAIACHTSLAVSHRGPGATTHLGGGTGHTAEMAAFARERTNSRNPAGTTQDHFCNT